MLRPLLCACALAALSLVPATSFADQKPDVLPANPKALKSFHEAEELARHRQHIFAAESYVKAHRQEGEHCALCLSRAYVLYEEAGDYKQAVGVARMVLQMASTPVEQASAHFLIGHALQYEAMQEKKRPLLEQSVTEFRSGLALQTSLYRLHYDLGVSLARLQQDDEARAEMKLFLTADPKRDALYQRAQRLSERIELARANMAPAFAANTLDGKSLSLDSLAGKVVLVDFWATWCGPCREALPHLASIVKKFNGQPLVVISISLDSDDAKWKEFVGKNQMSWVQVRDKANKSSVADLFNVHAIPSTFTIDADGVIEDQHVGDASLEGKLKKLLAQASARAAALSAAPPSTVPTTAVTN